MKEESMRVAVVGGGGFVGKHLLTRFRALDIPACSMDISAAPQPSSQDLDASRSYYRVDVTDLQQVQAALDDFSPSCVVHLAGWGMSGSPMLSARCHVINTVGTKNVITACQHLQQQREEGGAESRGRGRGRGVSLLYLSTYNTVFGGEEILGGCEDDTPYFQGVHTDQYAPSKTLAEKAVLEANSTSELSTCVIRPAAIYGPLEERHFPRIVETIDSGLFLFRIGRALVDWVHVDNLVQSIELAVLKLTAESAKEGGAGGAGAGAGAAGEVFFISDGTPIDNFDFLQPLCAARGVRPPLFFLPVCVALLLARAAEATFYLSAFALGSHRALEPFLTTPEVLKVGVSHYFSIDKARQTLGYRPTYTSVAGSEQMAAQYRKPHMSSSRNFFQLVHPAVALLIAAGMALLTLFALEEPSALHWLGVVNQLKRLAYFVFRSRLGLRLVLLGAHAAHVYEACQAVSICGELGVRGGLKWAWALQTSFFGIGSLGILHARQDFVNSMKKDV